MMAFRLGARLSQGYTVLKEVLGSLRHKLTSLCNITSVFDFVIILLVHTTPHAGVVNSNVTVTVVDDKEHLTVFATLEYRVKGE